RAITKTAAVWVAVYGAYFVFRFAYYGALLPNPFYLKVGGPSLDAFRRGVSYVLGFFADRWFIPAFAFLAVPGVRHRPFRIFYAFAVLHRGWVVWIGGDFYPGHRFLVVLIPVLALLAGQVVAGVIDALGDRAGPWATPAVRLGAWLFASGVCSVAIVQ